MAKIDQPVTPEELLKGLRTLEKEGVELPGSPESLLNQVVNNTAKAYLGRKHNIKTQPLNAKEAKTEASSALLRKNMIAAGRLPKDDTDAHHIVPGNERRPWAVDYAEAARRILKRWGISINHEANGVYLPTSSKVSVPSMPNAYPHKKVHTKTYYLNIAAHLAQAVSRTQCLETLREIGEDLEDGIYPIRKGQ